MHIQFLGGATTVTGSQFLLVTARATILIDCGMFQGSPNESIRNRIPFAFDPRELDAVLLTHAHLDHCGLLPAPGQGRLPRADPRHGRYHRARDARPPRLGQAARGIREARRALGETPPGQGRCRRPSRRPTSTRPRSSWRTPAKARSRHRRRRSPPHPRPARRRRGRATPRPSSGRSRPQLDIDLDAPLYTAKDAERVARPVRAGRLRRGDRGRAGDPRDVRGRRPHPRLGDHPVADR